MTFLVCLVVIQLMTFSQIYRRAQSGQLHGLALIPTLGILVSGALLTLPLMMEIMLVAEWANGRPVPFDVRSSAPWLIGIGGLLSMVVYGYLLHRQRKAGPTSTFAIGPNAIGFVIGAYMAFVAYDHAAFYHSSNDDAGVLNWAILKQEGRVKDVQCDAEVLVVKDTSADVATYRCPLQPLVVMDRFSSAPFIPWPTYTEGTSNQLATAIRSMQRDASSINAPTHHQEKP
jgi:hypothetical protein